MLLDTVFADRCPCCGQPRRLAHLIDLYERNYRLLERLIPELELPFERAVSRSATDLPLVLTVVERAPYTAELRLTYEFDTPEGRVLAPDLWIKLYRDARVAEVLHCGRRLPWLAAEEGDPQAARFLHDQWTRNHLLAKWLEYLLEHGHGFSVAARPRQATLRA
ncbi:MAG: DUF1249 domain-containing protein [Sinobacteraceae bacterium]|jgi:uncharacterized protein YqiB (DUF1249 family)|nr:DUF1249 domain-containing protein [Nevskia sp.]MDI3260440.1 DUF1249 domain-containing protein [Nevskiaceae bacterium]